MMEKHSKYIKNMPTCYHSTVTTIYFTAICILIHCRNSETVSELPGILGASVQI